MRLDKGFNDGGKRQHLTHDEIEAFYFRSAWHIHSLLVWFAPTRIARHGVGFSPTPCQPPYGGRNVMKYVALAIVLAPLATGCSFGPENACDRYGFKRGTT